LTKILNKALTIQWHFWDNPVLILINIKLMVFLMRFLQNI